MASYKCPERIIVDGVFRVKFAICLTQDSDVDKLMLEVTMDQKINEKKRMNYFVSAEVAEIFQLFYEAQDPPLGKSVLHEITLTRGMFFDGDTILELRTLLDLAEEFLGHRQEYTPVAWENKASQIADRLNSFINSMEAVK